MLKRKKTSILIDNPVTSFQYVETIRKLRRRVEQHMGSGQVLMVTSLLENEGKSTVAVNLALSLAQKHNRVLLIDCDLRKPACHNILDHKQFTCGIKEVLQGKANLADAVLRHQSTRLYLLLAKKGDQTAGDLIASERMRILLDWARKNFDYVVLDLPPMAAAADAEAMTALADASIMVVRQNEAVAPALNKAMSSLEGRKAKLLGCVLNNVHTSRISSGGGYGYGYGYGKYHKYNYYKSYGSGK
jgi:capsular exopolysaccharide synthesis family protein